MRTLTLAIALALFSTAAFSSTSVTSRAQGLSRWFTILAATASDLKRHKEDAYDRAMRTASSDLRSYCLGQDLELDEDTITVIYERTTLEGGSRQVIFKSALGLRGECF